MWKNSAVVYAAHRVMIVFSFAMQMSLCSSFMLSLDARFFCSFICVFFSSLRKMPNPRVVLA